MARSPLLEIHFLTLWICVGFSAGSLSHAQVFPGVLGPLPHPPENPPTSEKIRLGQFLFWDEQLSSDNSTACGTCHLPEVGGGDPRAFEPFAAHPGTDAIFGTEDDVRGSVGVPRQSCDGSPLHDPTFGWARRVTSRQAPSMIAAGLSPLSFWDGRATGEFRDPLSGDLLIASGGALESQVVEPTVSAVEMACEGRDWSSVVAKLATVAPLALARDLPLAWSTTLQSHSDYPSLFESAFGTAEITPSRIALAIATYERTLLPNETPFDHWNAGQQDALTPDQQQGLLLVIDLCTPCHAGIEFTDHSFRNIGVRPAVEDLGRQSVTGDPDDAGRFKTPGLRNVKLRAPYFHNGSRETLRDVLDFYSIGGEFTDHLDPDMVPLNLTDSSVNLILDFLENGLTDPRVAAGLPPFEHPTLQPFFTRGDVNLDGLVDLTDAIALLEFLFLGVGTLLCEDGSDANDDGELDLADPITVVQRILGGPLLPAPTDRSLGPDPTDDVLNCTR